MVLATVRPHTNANHRQPDGDAGAPDEKALRVAESADEDSKIVHLDPRAALAADQQKLEKLHDQMAPLQNEINQLTRQFWVPKEKVVAEKYDLSASRYRQIEHEELFYEEPAITLARLRQLEAVAVDEVAILENMLYHPSPERMKENSPEQSDSESAALGKRHPIKENALSPSDGERARVRGRGEASLPSLGFSGAMREKVRENLSPSLSRRSSERRRVVL